MRSRLFFALAVVALVAAPAPSTAQALSMRDAKCVLINDGKIALLPPTDRRQWFVDGAVCPLVAQFKARLLLNAYPDYPRALADSKVSGDVLVQFIVGWQVDTSSVIVLQSSDSLFSNAVRAAMLSWTGEPALLGARSMPQWLALDVRFSADGCGLRDNPTVIESTGALCIAPKDRR